MSDDLLISFILFVRNKIIINFCVLLLYVYIFVVRALNFIIERMGDLESIIADCENDLASSDSTVKKKLESINTIIQIKSTVNKDLHYNDLYKHFKQLLIYYLEAIDDRKYEYDFVNRPYLLDVFNIFREKEKIALYDFLIRKLRIHGLEEEISFFIREKRKNEIKLLWNDFPSKLLTLLTKLVTYNIWSIVVTILFSYFIYFIILLFYCPVRTI